MVNLNKKNIIYILVLTGCSIFLLFDFKILFIEQYMKFTLRNSHIVVSLTTTPYRIGSISRSLSSIIKQNAQVKQIYLNVPYLFKRDNLVYTIPHWLDEMKTITILRTNDYGPATKLLGMLEQVKLPANAIIITLDDDIVYPKNIVLHLAYNSKNNPGHAIGLSGADLYRDADEILTRDLSLGLKTRYDYNGLVTILQGYAGIAYRYNFFDPSIFEINKFPISCINSDDLYFSFYLAKQSIPRRSIANEFIRTNSIVSDNSLAVGMDALHQQIPTPPDKHKACIAYLHNNYPEVDFK